MITTQGLIEAAKLNSGTPSYYRLARILDVSDQALTKWRNGHTPDDSHASKLAEMAGLDIGYVLACMNAERAKDEGLKAAWAKAAKVLESAALVLFLGILSTLASVHIGPDAHASTGQTAVVPTNFLQLAFYTS